MMRDNIGSKQVVHLGNLTLSGTTPAASAWVDLQGFNACTLMVVNNTVTDAGTASGFTLTMQHGDDETAAGAANVDATQVVGDTFTVTVTSDSADNAIAGGVGYNGSKRYVRFNGVGTTLTNADVSVIAILDDPSYADTTFIGTSVAAT